MALQLTKLNSSDISTGENDKINYSEFLSLLNLFMYICICINHSVHVEVRGELVGISFLLAHCEFQGLGSGCRA